MTLERPAALLLLLLPLLVLWLASRRGAALLAPTGALEWWRRTQPHESTGAARRRPPLALMLCASALAACALALGGPRLVRGGATTPWRIAVDRSPSMYLPSGGGTLPSRGGNRLDAALERLSAALSGPRVWLAWTGDAWIEHAGAAPPPEWLAAPWPPLPSPPFESVDRPGWVWLTDAAPARSPERAGLVAAGGAAVPGPVAVMGERWIVWDGARVVEEPRERRSRLALAPGVPPGLASLLEVWAVERGFAVQPDTGEDVELHVTARGSAQLELELGRDGWRASAQVDPAGALAFDENGRRLAPWLTAGTLVLVSAAPGRIDLALGAFDPAPGSEAACAVSWARLVDRCALAPPEVVPLPERAACEARLTWPAAPAPDRAPTPVAWPAAALTALAALCALGAYVSSTPP